MEEEKHNLEGGSRSTVLLIENCINKAFEKYIPIILTECARQAQEIKHSCNAHYEFRRDSDVDAFREMKLNYSKLRRKEIVIFTMITVIINGLITAFVIKKWFN